MTLQVDAESFSSDFTAIESAVAQHIRGKREQIRLSIVCMLSQGHLLIEDVPGVAKTSLAKALAGAIGGAFRRIQFTADLLPSDVTGVRIYDQGRGDFRFEEGPVFTNVLLSDEINRASPKTQAALLEVMAEKQVTVDGSPRPVPEPFVCIATQNPIDFQGTYSLPEAQLDRFMMRLRLGYPDVERESMVIADNIAGQRPEDVRTVLQPERIRTMSAQARQAFLAPALRRYIAQLAAVTRGEEGGKLGIRLGVSPRGSIALATAALVYAMAAGRSYATADDVKELAVPVLAHRLVLDGTDPLGEGADDVVRTVLARVEVPTQRELAVTGSH